MPLPGGDADKVGNRYEALWTVNCLLQILNESADSIHIEQIGEQWEGVEFELKIADKTEYHQVKRQNGNKGHWPLATLATNKVLENAKDILRVNSESSFIFISTDKIAKLPELIHRAKACQDSYEQFIQEAIKAKTHASTFEKLQEYLNPLEKIECFEFLKHFKTETIGESALLELIKAKASTLINGNPSSVVSLLRTYCENNLQTLITAHPLWHYLNTHGFSPVNWNQDENVHIAIERCNARYSHTDPSRLINNMEIPRYEVIDKLCTAIQNNKKIIAVIGCAGSGKSIVMQQAFNSLVDCGVITLGFRIDRLEPESTPKGIGNVLDLPESPVHVLAKIADGKPCVLFVDQLDAVSLTSGRNPHFFDCIDELFKQTDQYKNMKLVIGCREFDLENDHRFRSFMLPIKTEKIVVKYLSQEEVKEQLSIANLSIDRLNAKQLLLLTQPLFLGVFIQTATNEKAYAFTNIGDLFRLQIQYIRKELRGKGQKTHWVFVMKLLSRYMNQHQVLSAPERVVDEYEEDAQIIASSGILIYENKRYSFFHENFFDYLFANHFLNQEKPISKLLFSDEQYLFRRAQVRQILTLQRDDNFTQYLSNIEELLNHHDIRLHIKMSILSWLGQLEDPQQQELDILLTIANSEDEILKNCLWRGITGQVAWFKLLDKTGVINQWLTHDDESWVNHGIWFLRAIQRSEADRVAEIVSPFYESDKEKWQPFLLFLIQWSSLEKGRKYFELFLQLLADGSLDDARGPIAVNSTFWNILYSLKEERPEWIGELLVVWIKRQLEIKPLDTSHMYSLPESNSAKNIIQSASKKTPLEFFESFFPLFVELIEKTRKQDQKTKDCIRDSFWGLYLNDSFNYHMHTYIVDGMQTAIELIAENEQEYFQQFFDTWKNTPYRTIQHLLVVGLSKAGKDFSDQSIDYLLESDCHLTLGSGYGWLSRQLIAATTPFCNSNKLEKLEVRLLNFYGNPVSYSDRSGKKCVNTHFGYDQFTLLTGVYKPRQSKEIQLRIKEWQRKFLSDEPVSPKGRMRGGVVHSPISDKGANHMSDEQWLQAMARYDTDEHNFDNFLKGGARELSITIETRTAQEPKRFAKLCLNFPENTNTAYYEAIIRGLSTRNDGSAELIEIDLICACCEKIFNMENKPCGYSIPRLVSTYKNNNLPEKMLDMLLWYASNDPDPDKDSTGYSTNQGIAEDLSFKAINSVRGIAVGAIADLIFASDKYYRYFKPYLSNLCQSEENLAVRSEIAYIIIAVSNYDKKEAFDLFDLLVSDQSEELFAARWIEKYINYAIFDDFQRISPYIQQMLSSELAFIKQAGARQACVAGLVTENNEELIQQCFQGDIYYRKGAAELFANNITSELYSKQSKESLSILFDDQEKEVRDEAARCFYEIKKQNLDSYQDFIVSFINSHAIENNTSMIEHLLEKSVTELPDIILLLIEQFIERQGMESGDINTGASADAYQLSKLLIRLYSQTNLQEIKSRCLNAIDSMIGFGSSGLGSELEQFDR